MLAGCDSIVGCSRLHVVIATSSRCGVKHNPRSAVPDCMLDNSLVKGTVRILTAYQTIRAVTDGSSCYSAAAAPRS